jgi:MYXO-CTERM domain-containing protein
MSKFHGSIFAVAASATLLVSQARGVGFGFNYDLRLAPGQEGIVDSHNVVLDAGSPSSYTLQLWGQIAGDGSFNGDRWISGLVSAESVQSATPAFTSGGITGVTIGSHVTLNSVVGTANSGITADGITDWGSASLASTAGYTEWGTAPAGVEGTKDAESEAENGNTWEVLLATYTVGIGGVTNSVGGLTSIDMLIPRKLDNGDNTLSYVSAQDPGESQLDSANFTLSGNVNFATTGAPEPGALGLLAIGSLTLVSRRRHGKSDKSGV